MSTIGTNVTFLTYLLSLIGLFGPAGVARADSPVEDDLNASVVTCRKSVPPDVPVALDFCLQTPTDRKETDLLVVYLHGMGGNERTWQTYGLTRDLEKALRKAGRRPAILSPSFGEFWLLKETPTPTGVPALLPIVDELVARTRWMLPAGIPVVVVGTSLGGFNGLQLYFKRASTYAAFALAGAAVVDATPFGSEAEVVTEYVRRSRARVASARTMFAATRSQFLDETDFARHNPLSLALGDAQRDRTHVAPHAPLMLQVGADDHFGFQLGNAVLQHFLRVAALPVTFQTLAGGRGVFDHVVLDATRMAEFLSNSARQP